MHFTQQLGNRTCGSISHCNFCSRYASHLISHSNLRIHHAWKCIKQSFWGKTPTCGKKERERTTLKLKNIWPFCLETGWAAIGALQDALNNGESLSPVWRTSLKYPNQKGRNLCVECCWRRWAAAFRQLRRICMARWPCHASRPSANRWHFHL